MSLVTRWATVRWAAEAGLAGCVIEDATKDKVQLIYLSNANAKRTANGVDEMNALDFNFKLTGRCENFPHGNPDLDYTIRRLQVHKAAGGESIDGT